MITLAVGTPVNVCMFLRSSLAAPQKARSELGRGSAHGSELAREGADEARVVAQVASPQAAGLPSESIGPLESGVLDPRGGLLDESRVEVEGRTDPDEDRGTQARTHFGHPLLLLGHADPHPHHIGP